ncbi:MAG: hypothetical protein IKT09_07535 [Synergistes sp.]|nr:hypothetical protein [Synergistes sp.]
MILTTQMLIEQYHNYANPKAKIRRLVDSCELYPLTRGIYETNGNTPGQCLAGAIYGPSYLSFDYALADYGLIPEAVRTFTSATFEKKKKKEYVNHFGRFAYRDVPSDVYPFGIVIREENGYPYHMACPEKALCDKLYTMPPVTSQREIERMLFEDLRVDSTEFAKLDTDGILQIGDMYHSNNLKYLMKCLRRKAL